MLDDLTNLQALLKDSTLLATRGYIAGEWCDGENGQTFPVYNPARGDVITGAGLYTGKVWPFSPSHHSPAIYPLVALSLIHI